MYIINYVIQFYKNYKMINKNIKKCNIYYQLFKNV